MLAAEQERGDRLFCINEHGNAVKEASQASSKDNQISSAGPKYRLIL